MDAPGLFRRILVPIDFSGSSQEALRLAQDIARQCGSKLTLLHVYEPPSYQVAGEAVFLATPDLLAQQLTSLTEKLDRLKAEVAAAGFQADTILAEGNAYSEILREANSGNHDLLVMGTHGHTGLKHLLLGSVAERVVRTAHCPVLTVRSHEHRIHHP